VAYTVALLVHECALCMNVKLKQGM